MRAYLLCLLGLLLGCANMNTVGRYTPLLEGGMAIHLDAAQRVIIGDPVNGYCSEPTPDALQAFAASQSLSGKTPNEISVALSNSYAVNSASVGLHTQSITLMREEQFRICEAARNKHISRIEAVGLLQRSQDVTLAILAIEQLTGASVAKQASLTPGATSSASADLGYGQKALEAALNDQKSKEAALAQAQAARDAAKTAQDKSAADLASPPAGADPAALQNTDNANKAKLAAAEDALKVAKAELDTAKARVEQASANLKTSVMQAQTGTTGGGTSPSATSSSSPSTAESVKYVADATREIVEYVVGKGRLTDSCSNFVSYALQNGQNWTDEQERFLTPLLTKCSAVLDADIKLTLTRAEQEKQPDEVKGAQDPVAAAGAAPGKPDKSVRKMKLPVPEVAAPAGGDAASTVTKKRRSDAVPRL